MIPFISYPLWLKIINSLIILIFFTFSLLKANKIYKTEPGIIPKPFSFQVDPEKEYKVEYTDLHEPIKFFEEKRFKLLPEHKNDREKEEEGG